VNDLSTLDYADLIRIARAVGMSATGVERVLAGAVDGPQADRIRALAAEALGRLPAYRRVVTVNGRNSP
jgi:hypothetical protein